MNREKTLHADKQVVSEDDMHVKLFSTNRPAIPRKDRKGLLLFTTGSVGTYLSYYYTRPNNYYNTNVRPSMCTIGDCGAQLAVDKIAT